MTPDTSKNPPLVLEAIQLFDIAETAASAEAAEWGEDPGLNLFLEDTIALLRRELELMPRVCGARTGERARLFVMIGRFSDAVARRKDYAEITESADVWVIGVPDVAFPTIPGVQTLAVTADAPLARERSVIVDSPSFGVALFAHEAGRLEDNDENSRYFEGFLTARPEVVEAAAQRLTALLKLPPFERHPDHNLTLSWHSRLNARFLEHLEGQKLALRARTVELESLTDERRRLETLARGYIGGQTWDEMQEAVEQGHSVVADRRQELTICFCDLVGFTQLSERLHPTEVATFLNDHYSKLHDIVRAHGGWIDKFIGDAMLAVFENPVEAMIAAQKMVRESRRLKVTDLMEQAVQVRVGLNTGVVAVANLGVPEHRERTVLGDAVNTAQRLQSAAQPHTIVLSARTFSRLPFALARTLEPIDVQAKGKKDTVLAYRWWIHSDRRAPDERIALRGSLLNAARRAPLFERLRGGKLSGEADDPQTTELETDVT